MTHDIHAPGEQPAPAPQVPGADAGQSGKGAKKWAALAAPVVVAAGVGAYVFVGGVGDPEVGDCVQMKGETDFEVVDCGADEAEFRIVGVDDTEQTFVDMQVDPEVCMAFSTWEVALWIGDDVTAEGTTYCAESV
jgi:hypothetical protein